MDNAGLQRSPACDAASPDRSRPNASYPCRIFWRKPELRDEPIEGTFGLEDEGHVCTAQLGSGLYERIQYRLQIEGRAADDFQDIARRGLVFERLLKVVRSLPQFPEQPRVLHRDHCLCGEIFQ